MVIHIFSTPPTTKTRDEESFIREIQNSFEDYKSKAVKRVYISKANGKTRPLGIPSMKDRLIQQCIKQVIEPICEAKFYGHSYGFRPNRSTHDAMARCQHLVNRSRLHYVVDVDIEGFFDNVNHTKLIKQCYNIGIKDKRVLGVIVKMLKAPIKGEGTPSKGTPQGGILSPLLSNIVLNDLDWWVSSQWENFKTRYRYSKQGHKIDALKKKSLLKTMYIVRYADDFKVFTNSHENAYKIYHGIKGYLEDNLKLNISKEKSKVINLRKNKSEFLGFEIKAVKKGKKYVANTFVSEKSKKRIKEELKQLVIAIQKKAINVIRLNQYILGIHNYYKIATHINVDFAEIAYQINRTLYNRLKQRGKYGKPKAHEKSETYKKFYKNNYKTYKIGTTSYIPIS